MYTTKPFIMIVLLILLFGCSSPIMPSDVQPLSTETSIPILAPSSTTSNAPLSLTDVVEVDYPMECINLTSTLLKDTLPEGMLVVSKELTDYYLFDLQTSKILEIGNDQNRVFAPIISPNKKVLLARTCGNDECFYILRTVDRMIKTNIPYRNDWIPNRWLDNEHIEVLTTTEPHDIVIFNPFTDEEKRVNLNIPNPETMVQNADNSVIFAYIDASLKQVVFSDQVFHAENQNGRLILWNLETQKEIASLPPPAVSGSSLSSGWSPDAKEYVTPWPAGWGITRLANELFVWDMEGNQEKLTDLNQRFPFANIENPVWSPDSRYIAFWLKISNAANPNTDELRQWLAVVDTTTLDTKIYCLANGVSSRLAYRVVWSPNGDQLIVNISFLYGKVKPILVDLISQTQTEIPNPQNIIVDDWMTQ